jgi:hypothetical protein
MRTQLLKCTLGLIFFLGTSLTAIAQPIINTQDVSNPNSCDGAAWFMDSTMNSTTIFWQGNGTVLQQGGYGITGLCAGTYTVTFQDLLGNNTTLTFIIGANNDPCAGFYAVGQSTDVSAAGVCDGTAWVTATGGTAPYTYSWVPGGQTVPQAGNLCEGTYTVVAVDANGCAFTVQMTIGNGSNNSDSTLIINNGTPNGGVVDTLGNNMIDDCVIDFSVIDSAYVNGVISGADSVVVTWVVIDNTGAIVQTYTVSYPSPNSAGNYAVVITITCPQRASGINTLVAYDYIELQEASLTDAQFEKLTVLNPFTNELVISGMEIGNTISITDMAGRMVYSGVSESTTVSINSGDWSNGMYVLHISNEAGRTTEVKVIK